MADETINIGINIEGTEKLKTLREESEKTGNATKELGDDVHGLGKRFEDVYGDLQPMSSRLGEIEDRMYELANANQTSSKEFQVLQKEAIKFRKTIRAVDTSVDQAAEGGARLNSALTLSSGVVASYTGFISLTALLGDENEKLMETMVKLQAAESALQSIQSINYTISQNQVAITKLKTAATAAYNTVVGKGTVALKAFRVALAATGIGLAIVAISALVANWEKVTEALGQTTKMQKLMNEAIVEGVVEVSKELKAIDDLTESINRNGKSRADVIREIKQFKTDHPEMLKSLNEEEATMVDLNKAIEDQSRLVKILAIEKALASQTEELYKEMIAEQVDLMTQQNIGFKENALQTLAYTVGMGSVIDVQKGANETSKENISTINEQIDAIDQMRSVLMGQAEDLGHVNDKYADEKRAMYEKRLAIDKEIESVQKLARTEDDIQKIKANKSLVDGEDLSRPDIVAPDIETNEEIYARLFQMEVDFQNGLSEYRRMSLDDREELEKKVMMDRVEIASSGFNAIGQLAEAFAGQSEEQAKRMFYVQKGASIASALMQTYMSANAAYASQFLPVPTPDSPIRGGIAAGVAVASGLANVAMIAKQKFQGGGSVGGGASSGGRSVGSNIQSRNSEPEINLFGQGNEGGEGGDTQFNSSTSNPPQMKAYVVQSELQAISQDNAQYMSASQM